MAWYPDAIRKPVERYKPGGSSHQSMPNPRRLCYHTAVSSGDSLFALFNTPGNAVAHFYIRDDGKVEQYVNTNTRASANLDGNHDTISVESWDAGGNFRKWTDRQVEACAKLAAWVHKTHGIPLEKCDASPGSRGVTWHRKGIDGNFPSGLLSGRKPGDEHWSTSAGKECPFDGKIQGVVNDIIPRAKQLSQGDDMPSVNDILSAKLNPDTPAKSETVRSALNKAAEALDQVKSLATDVQKLRDGSAQRDKAIRQALAELGEEGATAEQVQKAKDQIIAVIGGVS